MMQFPIMHGKLIKSIPWDLLSPHEAQAKRNHQQSLKVLASRGGLDPIEAVCVIEGKKFPWKPNGYKKDEVAEWEAKLIELVNKFKCED